MRFSDETLMAFADGELPEAEAAQVRAALAADPMLAKRVERFRNVRRALRATYDSVAQEPIPERLRALLGDMAAQEPAAPAAPAITSAPVVDLAAALAQRRAPAQRFTPPVWAALAASVLVGLFAGRLLTPAPQSLLAAENGQLRAGAALTRVLDTRLGGDADTDLHVGLSFRAQDGRYCRTFDRIEANKAVSGLACREPEAWVVRIATTEPVLSSTYRQAGSAAPAVMEMVDSTIDGDPLTPAQERAARDHSWH